MSRNATRRVKTRADGSGAPDTPARRCRRTYHAAIAARRRRQHDAFRIGLRDRTVSFQTPSFVSARFAVSDAVGDGQMPAAEYPSAEIAAAAKLVQPERLAARETGEWPVDHPHRDILLAA
jgi:hypothetical protein